MSSYWEPALSAAQAKQLAAASFSPVAFFGTFTGTPGAGTIVVLDSLALGAGDYMVIARGIIETQSNNNGLLDLEHRNAANAANIRRGRLILDGSVYMPAASLWWPRVTLAANERIRIVGIGAIVAVFGADLTVIGPI